MRFLSASLPLKTIVLGAALSMCSAAYAAVPSGWHLAGSAPQDYEAGTRTAAAGPPLSVAFLRSNGHVSTVAQERFGTMMQSFSADRYAGHRVRLSADVKADDLSGWAGLWMRADQESKTVAFDNMQNRAIRGNQDWRHYEVVLDIPPQATSLHLGVLLAGGGEVDVSDVKFEVLPDSRIPQIGPVPMQTSPVNLDFEP